MGRCSPGLRCQTTAICSCQASDEMPFPSVQAQLLVKKFGGIRSLDCTCLVGPRTEQFTAIASLRQLQSLAIRGNYMTGNDAIRIVATLSALTQLRFDDAKALMDDGLAALSNLHCLASLSLKGADGLQGGGLSSLLFCNQLRVRLCPCLDVTSADWPQLRVRF